MTAGSLSLPEVAVRWSVDRRTVSRWARRGVLPTQGRRRGRRVDPVGVPTDDGVLLSAGAAAAILGVHPTTVSRMDKAGKLRAVRTPGAHRRFREAEVRALAAVRTAERQAAAP